MGITPGRYRSYDDHTVECLHCTADSNGTVALIPETAIEAHELWHAGPEVKRLLTPLEGSWPELPADRPTHGTQCSHGRGRDECPYCHPETRIPELTDEQLTEWAEEAWKATSWPASEHDAWVEAYLRVGRMLSGKVIKG